MGENNAFAVTDASAKVLLDDQNRPYVEVNLDFAGQNLVFVIHQSLAYADTINVEIDGDFSTQGLRINLNDGLIYDATLGLPAIEDNRPTELDDWQGDDPDDPEAVAISFTRAQLNDWTGRELSTEGIERLVAAIPFSSIPAAMSTMADITDTTEDNA